MTNAPPAPMLTSPDKVMLGRYHAREVILSEIQRRRVDATAALNVAKKDMKKLEAEVHEADDPKWLERVGRQTQLIKRIVAEKQAASEDLNKHINGRALPLFEASPDDVAIDCIVGGIALLFEQEHDADHIREVLEREFQIAEFRHKYEELEPEKREAAVGQGTLFSEEEDRGQLERRLAHMLGRNFPAPLPFTWIEIAAHLTDAEVRTAWAWAAAPHRVEQPPRIVEIMQGKGLEGFERDPKLPALVRLTDAAAERIGKQLVLEIDDTGRVLLTPPVGEGPVVEIGKIDPSQTTIPVFAAVRLLGAAANGYQTTRDDWTWREREERRKVEVAGMSGVDNGGLRVDPPADDGPPQAPRAKREATEISREEIVEALEAAKAKHVVRRGNVVGPLNLAAQALGVHRDSLRRRCKSLDIDLEQYRVAGEGDEG